jgi:hypothetical protein
MHTKHTSRTTNGYRNDHCQSENHAEPFVFYHTEMIARANTSALGKRSSDLDSRVR